LIFSNSFPIKTLTTESKIRKIGQFPFSFLSFIFGDSLRMSLMKVWRREINGRKDTRISGGEAKDPDSV
jgi:hypothetical protein